ncbi:hypothetical protein GCM10022240_31250 [Microbacterium kribbense]|uniref:HTH araC/xylS-type domain-containing protein n=1 Tax=Microbacterium kribbense TaxID=433645 RepID=A0ABP7GWN9_9MICO
MSMMLDTRAVAPADRSDYWSAGIAAHFFPVRVEPFDAAPFDARLSGGDVGPLFVRTISGNAHRVARTPRLVDSGDPECILLYLVRQGACRIEQDGRRCELRPGDLGAHDTSRPSVFEAPVGFDVLVFAVPKWLLGREAREVVAHTATRVGGVDTPLIRLALPLLSGIAKAADGGGVTGPAGEVAGEMLLPVIRSLYGDREGDRATSRSGLLPRMRRYALAHLHDPQLGPEQIAEAHYVSVRYVHKLFAASGGASAWIRRQRMDAAADELRATSHPVSQIAGHVGYADAASFARAFRREFGRSPREVRRS